MADKNHNGIPDSMELTFGGLNPKKQFSGLDPKKQFGALDPKKQFSGVGNPSSGVWDPLGGVKSFLSGILGPHQAPKPKPASTGMGALAPIPQAPEAPVQQQKTLGDYMAEAMQQMGSAGIGAPRVDYSNERSTLQGNYANNDAKLEAMYRQLSNSIAADAPTLQAAYQGAIDQTKSNSAEAQKQTQQAADLLEQRRAQVAANLGIQQAQGNAIQNGTDAGGATAAAIAGQASKGQAALDQLSAAQSAALQHNTNVGTAARQEGTTARSLAQAKLSSLLSQIDMQQQQSNAQYASSGSNNLSSALSYAKAMFDADQQQAQQNDLNSYRAAQLSTKNVPKASPNINDFLKYLGVGTNDVTKDPQGYANLLSTLSKFNLG